MKIHARQVDTLHRSAVDDFHGRLDRLLLARAPTYASLPESRRREGLARITAWAQSCGIREELYIGLFTLLVVQRGPRLLEHAEARAILDDPARNSAAKVYQCYAFAAGQR